MEFSHIQWLNVIYETFKSSKAKRDLSQPGNPKVVAVKV